MMIFAVQLVGLHFTIISAYSRRDVMCIGYLVLLAMIVIRPGVLEKDQVLFLFLFQFQENKLIETERRIGRNE